MLQKMIKTHDAFEDVNILCLFNADIEYEYVGEYRREKKQDLFKKINKKGG